MLSDLRRGKEGEAKVLALLRKAGFEATDEVLKDDRPFFDVVATYGDWLFTIEVKNDIYALRSGNIAIEAYNTRKGKPSGINITKSTMWAHLIGEEVWLANTAKLKDFVQKTPPTKVASDAGDGNAALLLFNRDLILPAVFHRVDDKTPEELWNKIEELKCPILPTQS